MFIILSWTSLSPETPAEPKTKMRKEVSEKENVWKKKQEISMEGSEFISGDKELLQFDF